jgi:alginate O-acetyltransferase complex protein AlgJ
MSTRYLCGIAIIIFLVLAAVLFLHATYFSGNFDSSHGLLRGKATKAYEEEFDKNLGHRDISIKLWNSAGYLLFGEGVKGVLIGRDGWLFTNEEFIYGADFEANLQENQNYVLKVFQKLDVEGIKLVILPVPSKARVYQDRLGRYQFPEKWSGQYQNFLNFLEDNHIAHDDLLNTFIKTRQNSLYLRTDTHWTPIGARLAAMKISNVVQNQFPYLSWKSVSYKSAKGEVVTHEGDLMRYTVIDNNAEVFSLIADQFNQWKTERQGEQENSLFGNPDLPLTLVGTSYSANPLWNFDGFLKEFLGTDILNVADEGLGPFETMHNYMNGQTYQEMKPKLVIWEIPERYLGVLPEFMKEEK